jgi:hypothetical protein
MSQVDDLLRDAMHASWMGMDSKAAGLFRRLAIIHQERATARRIAGIKADATGIQFEPVEEPLPVPEVEDLTYDLPQWLRRAAE